MSYADEHSTFFVSPDESTHTPVRRFEQYYPFLETPVRYKDIPVLVDKPIAGWPPEEIFGIGEEVIIGNPWEWNQESIRTNMNFSKMLPTNDAFTLGEVVFDTTGNDLSVPPPQRFWRFLRFRQETKAEFIQELLTELAKGDDNELKERMEKSIRAWRDKPFQPHVIARTRYLAYQLNVLMKYLDNLIAWGDNLFRQDTIETLDEAIQIDVLAANILGPKPMKVPARGKRTSKTYKQLKDAGIDAFGNALIEIENDFPFNTNPTTTVPVVEGSMTAAFGIGRSLYFCIPQNDKLLGYWDLVADRLFKNRH